MVHIFRRGRQSAVAVFALVFSVATLMAAVLPGVVSADQLTNRSIVLSDSAASSGNIASNGSTVGTGQNVSYDVNFRVATAGGINGIVVSFCGNSPIPASSDGCSAITGFALAGTPTVTNQTGIDATNWTATSTAGGGGAANHTFVYTHSTAATSLAAGTSVRFTINGTTNPSTSNTPFYARIFTYTTSGGATSYTDATPGTTLDYGGAAMSTSNVISITARVMETLTFCVSGAAPTANCTGTTAAALIIGHGPNNIIDSSVIDTKAAYSQISTNANGGAIIRMRNSNLCGGLSNIPIGSQTTTTGCEIPPQNNNTAGAPIGAAKLTAGTANFGVNVSNGTIVAASGGSGVVTANGVYNNQTLPTDTTYAGMNTSTSASNAGVSSTYGDAVASSTGPVNNINNTYTFQATAANATRAGVYTANMALIATGTY